MTDVCCGKNLCQNKIRWSIILRYGLHILFTRRYHLPQANFDQEHFVIWKWFVYHHFCDKCSSWTQNNLLFHSITVKTPSPVNLYYCFYYYKDTVSRLQCISHFYSLNRVAWFVALQQGAWPSPPVLYKTYSSSFGEHRRYTAPTTRTFVLSKGTQSNAKCSPKQQRQEQGMPQLFMSHPKLTIQFHYHYLSSTIPPPRA